MGFFRKFLSSRRDVDISDSGIFEMVCAVDYNAHYAPIFSRPLGSQLPPYVCSELYFFRSWTTQFGYRIFSDNRHASESLINATVDTCFMGDYLFYSAHGYSAFKTLGSDVETLLNDRWGFYDSVIESRSMGITDLRKAVPVEPVIQALSQKLKVTKRSATSALEKDFIDHLVEIRRRANAMGIL